MTTSIPIIQVSHLPSASSFYASLTQPLGLRYLSATQSTLGPATLDFGRVTDTGNELLFSITQATSSNPTPITVILPALTPNSVKEFWNKSQSLGQRDSVLENTEVGENTKAVTRDLDRNMLEAVYSPGSARSRVQTIETASTEKEARRVLEWQKDVAKSVSSGDTQSQAGTEAIPRSQAPAVRRADSYPQTMRLVTRQTVTEHYHDDPTSFGSAPVESSGFSGKAILGTLLGAAAGAAVAYAMVRSESPEHVLPSPPAGYARAPVPTVVERVPATSRASQRPEEPKPRYAEYTIVTPQPPPMTRAHTYDLGRIDEQSYVSTHRPGRSEHHSTRERSPSEHGSRFEKPLTLMPAPPRDSSPDTHVSKRSHRSHRSSGERSHVSGSHHSGSRKSHTKSHHSHVSSRHHDDEKSERESYTSARSHHSESTVKPAKSHVSTTTITVVPRDERRSHVSAREVPLPRSEISMARDIPLPRSTVSLARDMPLPRSEISMARDASLPRSTVSGAGYAASVAPSDSVSSVGTKRERERLMDRMSQRSGGW